MKTTAYIGTSLDGFIARKDGDIDWLTQFDCPETSQTYTEFIRDIDAIVMGRGTFEKVITFPSWFYQQKVFVLSSQIKQIPDDLKDEVSLVTMEPKELLPYLSSKGFTNLYIDGGKVIQSFLRENLLDELIITKVPVLIGDGIPLFGGLDHDINLVHKQSKAFPNGLVMCHYEKVQR